MTPEEKAERLRERRAAKRWTLEEAIVFLHDLQEHLREKNVPYFVGLSGSVLYGETRSSDKDIDVIVYPRDSTKPDEAALKTAFVSFGLKMYFPREFIVKMWRKAGSEDTKHVEGWYFGYKRIDMFFLS